MTSLGTKFGLVRKNGKSNQQVVLEVVANAQPGDVFTYDVLADALQEGTDRLFDRERIQQIIRLSNRRLLRDFSRYLVAVHNVGYKMAHARDHRDIASGRSKRGKRQFKWAMDTMRHARLDEMTEKEKTLHIAQTAINTELYQAIRRVNRKQDERDRLVAKLTHRVEQLEAKTK